MPWKHRVLTTGPPGKSQDFKKYSLIRSLPITSHCSKINNQSKASESGVYPKLIREAEGTQGWDPWGGTIVGKFEKWEEGLKWLEPSRGLGEEEVGRARLPGLVDQVREFRFFWRHEKAWEGFQHFKQDYNITNLMDMNLSKLQEIVEDREAWHVAVHGVAETWLSDWTTTTIAWSELYLNKIT